MIKKTKEKIIMKHSTWKNGHEMEKNECFMQKKILDIKLDSYEENKGLTKWAT